MLIKITKASVFRDNGWLRLDPIFSKLEDKHIKWLAFMIDPWSPLRFIEDEEKRKVYVNQLAEGLKFYEGSVGEDGVPRVRPNDVDFGVWDAAMKRYAEMCPDGIKVHESIEALRELIKSMNAAANKTLPENPKTNDLALFKVGVDMIRKGDMAKAYQELDALVGKFTYKPEIITEETETEDKPATGSRRAVDSMDFT